MTADPRSDKRKKTVTAFARIGCLGVNDDSDDSDFDFRSVFNSELPRPSKAKQAELPVTSACSLCGSSSRLYAVRVRERLRHPRERVEQHLVEESHRRAAPLPVRAVGAARPPRRRRPRRWR